ncbi:unnamed protein product, partial [Hymenolepis diminuta]
NLPKGFFFLKAQSRVYEITTQNVLFTCLRSGLTPEVTKLLYDILEKSTMTPYDDEFALLELIGGGEGGGKSRI